MNDGPTLVTPEPYYVCNGCRYLKMTPPANMGHDTFKVTCKNRGVKKMPPIMYTETPSSVAVRTPDWCPRKEVANAKPNPT